MPHRGTAAAASQHLPAAVVLLALSVATLAAVLANIERGREHRSKHAHESRREIVPAAAASNDQLSTAVTAAAPATADDTPHHSAAAPTGTATDRGDDRPTVRGRDNPLLPSRGGDVSFAAVGGAEGRRGGPPLLQVDRQRQQQQQQQSYLGHGSSDRQDHAAISSPILAPPTPTNRSNDRAATPLAAAGSSAPKKPRTTFGMAVSLSGSSWFAGRRPPGTSSSAVDSAASKKARTESAPSAGGKRLEVLVHNISHKDMVLSLRRSQLAVMPRLGGAEPVTTSIDAVSDTPQKEEYYSVVHL